MEEETHSLCEKRLIANRGRYLWFMKEEINILWRKLPVVYGRKWSIVYGGRRYSAHFFFLRNNKYH